jgi:hypothetical protein
MGDRSEILARGRYKAEQSQKTWAAYTAQKLVEEWVEVQHKALDTPLTCPLYVLKYQGDL